MAMSFTDKNEAGSIAGYSKNQESHLIHAKRKRQVLASSNDDSNSVMVDDEVAGHDAPAMSFAATKEDMFMEGPLPSFRKKPPPAAPIPTGANAKLLRQHGNNFGGEGASQSHRGNSSVESHARPQAQTVKPPASGNTIAARTKSDYSNPDASKLKSPPADEHQDYGQLHNRSDSASLHRPRKQTKQALLNKLNAYGSNDNYDEESAFEDDDGDVSGEDVFSEGEHAMQGNYKLGPFGEAALGSRGREFPSTRVGLDRKFSADRRVAERVDPRLLNIGFAGRKQSHLGNQQPNLSGVDPRAFNGGAGHSQPYLGYQRSNFSDRDPERARAYDELFNQVGVRGQEQPSFYHGQHPYLPSKIETETSNRGLFNGLAGQKQPFLSQSSHSHSSEVSKGHIEAGMASSQLRTGLTSDSNWGSGTSRSPNTRHSPSSYSQEVNTRLHPQMMSQQHHLTHQNKASIGIKPPRVLSTSKPKYRESPPSAATYSSGTSVYSVSSRRGAPSDPRAPSEKLRTSHGKIARLEAEIAQNGGLNHCQQSSSASSRPQFPLFGTRAPLRGGSQGTDASNSFQSKSAGGAKFAGLGSSVASGGAYSFSARHSASSNEVHQRATPTTSSSTPCPQNSRTFRRGASQGSAQGSESRHYKMGEMASGNSAYVNTAQSMAPRSIRPQYGTDDDRRQLHNVIANMAAVSQKSEGAASVSGQGKDWSSPRRTTAASRSGGNVRARSRDVIASIEADMMRLEEEQQESATDTGNRVHEMSVPVDPYRSNMSSGPIQGSQQQLASTNQGNILELMLVQQQQQQLQQAILQHPHGNRTLADQISNMALNPLYLQPDEESSATSINSCASYDGKCTNVFASRVLSQDQELACIKLNDAICDLYGAPVGKILRQHPMVTRLVRAEDETGNIQLHYAVRHGNGKAIRRIVRADPGSALIRNNHGYCPLHLAVQIGNFAAVQLLCSLAPASAEVQCEEGCLPLHEALSSAAHLPDAPQIAAALINTFPSAIKITNDEGLLPLHLCAMSGFSAGIRTIFAYGFSTIYARENTEEMLPLDFAVDGFKMAYEEHLTEQSEASDAAMTRKENEFRQCINIFLMSALYDRSVFMPTRIDPQGSTFLPIHGAAAALPCHESWQQIISMYGRDYASVVDVRGRTALHVLVTSPISQFFLPIVTNMIVDINELDSKVSTTYDDSGLVPLHTALVYSAPYPVIEYLLKCNGSTISMEVNGDCDNVQFRGMLPFQLAAACNCSIDIVHLLLRAHPIGVLGTVRKGSS